MSRKTNAIRQTIATGLALLGLLFVIGKCTGCAGATPQQKALEAEGTYASELQACVSKAKTLEESLECRRGVRARWGVDGGTR